MWFLIRDNFWHNIEEEKLSIFYQKFINTLIDMYLIVLTYIDSTWNK